MATTGLSVLITGTTGMVGEGVLHECLQRADIEKVLVINRKGTGITHPKLREIIHPDFFDFSPIASQLGGYDACFFCLGVSSIGIKEPEYYKLTYTLTLHVAHTLHRLNPSMTFCYISGAGTDSSEQGRSMWARVKGKTENDLQKLFQKAYAFRPGFIKPIKGLKHTHGFYNWIGWLFPIGRSLAANWFCTMQELAAAMISIAKTGYSTSVLEGKDIIRAAKPFST